MSQIKGIGFKQKVKLLTYPLQRFLVFVLKFQKTESTMSSRKISKSKINNISEKSVASSTQSRVSMMDDATQRQWIRVLLCKYLNKYIQDIKKNGPETSCSPITSPIYILDKNGNSHEKTVNKPGTSKGLQYDGKGSNGRRHSTFDIKCQDGIEANLNEMISILDYKIQEETAMGDDRISYLSRILSITITYILTGHNAHSMMWLIKIPSNNPTERNFARKINAYQREVRFYSDILENIKVWLNEHPIIITTNEDEPKDVKHFISLRIPQCYYAVTHSQEDVLPSDTESSEFPSIESTLILEDLRNHGYGKRHYGQGLTFAEAMESIREIAKVHAVTWVMSKRVPEKVDKWKKMLNWKNLFNLHLEMIKNGFDNARKLRSSFLGDKFRLPLLDRLLKIEPKLDKLFENLSKPLDPPAASALVHMDFWTDNLVFREIDSDETESQDSSDVDIDCMILDWQVVTWGRISHDVGVLLVTSLDSDIRRESTPHLIKFYYKIFQDAVEGLGLKIPFVMDDLIEQYRQSFYFAVLLAMGRFDLVVSEQSTLNRFFDALHDLKVENLI